MYVKNSDSLVNSIPVARISSAKSADLTILKVANLATLFNGLKSLVIRYFSYTQRCCVNLFQDKTIGTLFLFPSLKFYFLIPKSFSVRVL